MKELNNEINLTINMMQDDIDDGAYVELQSHLVKLLEIKRNVLEQRLAERSWSELGKPLTIDGLKAGGWWCADVSEECRLVFAEKGIDARVDYWSSGDEFRHCYLRGDIIIRSSRGLYDCESSLKQIHRVGNEFYWSEK